MLRIVPSEVVRYIERALGDAVADERVRYGFDHIGQLAGLVGLIDRIPAELVTLDGDDLVEFLAAADELRNAIPTLRSHGGSFQIRAIGGVSAVTKVYRALRRCPDEVPSPEVAELAFVDDRPFRDSLRLDLDVVRRALIGREWKAATVIAGSVAEALLQWSLEQRDQDTVAEAARAAGVSKRRDFWGLHEYSLVASQLRHISGDTLTALSLTRDFRNLIHPGRATRLGIQCDRGTAYIAVGCVEHVVRDLERCQAVAGGSSQP